MADYSGDLKYRITVDGAEASQAKLNGLGASFKNIASTVATSVAALVTFRQAVKLAGDAMANYENAIQATRQLNATLESTGRAAEFTSEELADMASGLQALSNYGDEDILQGVTLQLLRFDAIGRDIFPRAQKLVIDLAESMGGVENAARTLGISLADPTLGLTRLRRIGVAFNSTQEEQIKNFVETGKVAEAQAVLMSALEARFGGLATASVSATTQMKNAWGDYLEGLGESMAFIDGIKRGVTASLIDMAGQYDVTSKQARLAALDTQQAWGEAVINVANYAKVGLSIIGGAVTAVWISVKGVLDLIPRAMWVTFEAGKQAVIDIINGMVDAIIKPFELLFGTIDKGLTAIGQKGFGFDKIFGDLRKTLTLADSNVVSASESLMNSLAQTGGAFANWGANVTATGENAAHSIYEQTKILTAGIEAQRQAIENGLTGIDIPDLDLGMDIDAGAIDDYYSTVMALNNTASQKIMDKYNEMRAALGEYLRANTESQEEYQNKLRLGQAEIAKAETAELAAEKERQMSMVESFVNSVINLNKSEADAVTKKYADMRTTAEAYYADGLMSQQAFSEAITQINQAELDAITNLEAKRLDLRIQTLGSLRGFEDEFYYARITQIDAETEKLREAGLAEIEIEAWTQEQIAQLDADIAQRKIENLSEFEQFVLESNERLLNTLESSLVNSLAGMISGTKSALDVWKSLWANIAQAVIAEISKIIVKALFANTLLKALGMATGNIGAFFGIVAGAMTQSQGFIGPVNQAGYDPFAIRSAIDNNANQTTSALIRQERDNRALDSLSERIEKLATAIENNKPQIYTQVIEGVPFNNAIRRAAAVANEL